MKKIMLSLLLITMIVLSGCGKSNDGTTGSGIAVSKENGKTVISSRTEMLGGEYIITPSIAESEITAGEGTLMAVAVEDGKTRVAVTAVDGTVESGKVLFKVLTDKALDIKAEIVVTNDNFDDLAKDSVKAAVKRGTRGYRAIANSLLGDFNNDSTVNISDFALFSSNYGTSNTTYDIGPATLGTTAGWTDIYCQKNSDGLVNILDLIIFGKNYGKTSPTDIKITGTVNSIVKGTTTTLTANKTVNWAVSDSSIVSLSATSGTTVTVTGKAKGTVQITGTANGSVASYTLEVTDVIVPTVTAVIVDGTKTVDQGKSTTLTATVKYSDGTSKDEAVEWTTSDATVAKLAAASGTSVEVTGVKEGTATITATKDGKSVTVTVTVSPVTEAGITVYVEKPDSWSEIYMWYDSDLSTSAWDTTVLKADNGKMTLEGEWYKRNFPTAKEITFLFNDGTWGNKLIDSTISDNFNITKTVWITKDGKTHDTNPKGPTPAGVSASQASGTFATDGLEVTLNVTGTGVTSGKYVINGTDASSGTTYTNGTKITVGKGLTKGQKVTLTLYATDGKTSATETYTYEKTDVVVESNDIDNIRMYQVMVCSFQDGDPNVGYSSQWAGYRANGDIQGVINSLNYIKGMGYNAIWMTPVFYSDPNSNQGHTGYYANDFFNVDPKFGGNDALKSLISKAHDMGMYIILDTTMGHNAGSVQQGGSTSIAASPLSGKVPNGSNPVNYQDGGASLQYYKDVAYYWIKNYKIDGWRFDQSYQLGPGNSGHQGQGGSNFYWDDVKQVVEKACSENKAAGEKWGTLGYMVGEDWEDESGITTNTYGNSVQGLPSAFDFPTRYKIVQTLAREEYGKEINDASNLVINHSSYPSWAHPNLFIGNHDLARFGDLINYSSSHNNNYWKRHKAAMSYVAAFSGPITTYYGEEWGAKTGNSDLKSMHVARSDGKISGFSTEEADLIAYTSKLMNLRAENSALWQEKTGTVLKAAGNQYIQLKYDSATGNKVLYCLNIGTSAETFSATVSGATKLTDGVTGEVINGSGNFSIPMEGIQGRIFIVK